MSDRDICFGNCQSKISIAKLLKLVEMYVPNLTEYSFDLREFDKYALGTERDLSDFWDWIGMDFDKGESRNLRMQILKVELERIPTKTELLRLSELSQQKLSV